jgi:hypothetical protein
MLAVPLADGHWFGYGSGVARASMTRSKRSSTSSSCCGEDEGKRHCDSAEVMCARAIWRGVEGPTEVGGGVRYMGRTERMSACNEVSAREVMGPDVSWDRMSARNGWARSSGLSAVISTRRQLAFF